MQPARVVFDSLSEIRLLAQNPLRYRRQVLALKQFFVGRGCTGYGRPEDRQRSAEAGFDGHLTKPPEMAELHAVLAGRTVMEGTRSEGAERRMR